jgi:hypothetical protein
MREGVSPLTAAGDAKCGVEIFPIKRYKNKHTAGVVEPRAKMFWFYDFDFLFTPALLFPFGDLKTRPRVRAALHAADPARGGVISL